MRLGVGHDVHGLLRWVERDLVRSAPHFLASAMTESTLALCSKLSETIQIVCVEDFPRSLPHGLRARHLRGKGSRRWGVARFESLGHVHSKDGDFHAAIERKKPRHHEVSQPVSRSIAFGVGEVVTVQYSTVQYSTAQHSTAQHSTAQHSTAQHSAVQCSAVQCSAVQCRAVPCRAVPCSTL